MKFSVEVTDRAGLSAYVSRWKELAANAIERNAFYEPAMLLPGLESMPQAAPLFVFVFSLDPRSGAKGELRGFFPLERLRIHRLLPVPVLGLWEYGNCFLCTPLVHRTCPAQTLATFFDWLDEDPRSAPLFRLGLVTAEGAFHHHLLDFLRARGSLAVSDVAYTRAYLRQRQTTQDYLQAALTPDKRRDLDRKKRRLLSMGKLEFRMLDDPEDVETWIEDFLRLEASGWKGRAGTSLAQKGEGRTFFAPAVRQALRERMLLLQGLFLDDKPIAMRCSFVAGEGSFFFKPAYDEAYARFSPGVLLELETIRAVHDHPTVRWMDSCTSPDNELLNKLWMDRRAIHSVTIATKRGTGQVVIAALPMLRLLKRSVFRYTGRLGLASKVYAGDAVARRPGVTDADKPDAREHEAYDAPRTRHAD